MQITTVIQSINRAVTFGVGMNTIQAQPVAMVVLDHPMFRASPGPQKNPLARQTTEFGRIAGFNTLFILQNANARCAKKISLFVVHSYFLTSSQDTRASTPSFSLTKCSLNSHRFVPNSISEACEVSFPGCDGSLK